MLKVERRHFQEDQAWNGPQQGQQWWCMSHSIPFLGQAALQRVFHSNRAGPDPRSPIGMAEALSGTRGNNPLNPRPPATS